MDICVVGSSEAVISSTRSGSRSLSQSSIGRMICARLGIELAVRAKPTLTKKFEASIVLMTSRMAGSDALRGVLATMPEKTVTAST